MCYVAHEINKTPTHVVTMRERGSKYRYVMLIGKCLQEYLKFKRHPHCAHVKLYRNALILLVLCKYRATPAVVFSINILHLLFMSQSENVINNGTFAARVPSFFLVTIRYMINGVS